jgi:hypothetical protein
MDWIQSTPRDDGADDVLDDDDVLDVDDHVRVVREVRFERAFFVSRVRTRATNEFLNFDRVPRESSSFVRTRRWTNERTNERDDVVRIEAMVTSARVVGRSNARATRESSDHSFGSYPAWPNETKRIRDSDSD